MRSDGVRPTQPARGSMVAGQIAELAALPVLIVVVLLLHGQFRWGYLAGAIACVFASLLYFALFLALTRGGGDTRAQQLTTVVLSCLALATLGLLEVGTSGPVNTFLPGCLVVVLFVSIVGDRAMQLTVDAVAVVTVVVAGWIEGVRGAHLAAVTLVYAASIALITWLVSRAFVAPPVDVAGRYSAEPLAQAMAEVATTGSQPTTDPTGEILRRGLPLVAALLPAERITVFTRHADSGRFVPLATWPDGEAEVCADPGSRPEVEEALRTDRTVIGDDLYAIPIGYCTDGELILVLRRDPDQEVDLGAADTVEAVGTAFLRAISRANYVSSVHTENRTDTLTGLPNRRTLYERIEIEMEHALRSDSPLSVAMIDLDHFKQYNDRHGHAAGDTLLRSIAALFVSNVRGQDLVVRYGGEEFCLVMPDTDILGAHHLLDKLRDGGREATSEFGVTLSAGLTSWDGIEDTGSMIERADQALCRAKQTGRNRVVSIQSVTEY